MCLIYFSSIFHNFTIILFLSRSLFLKSKLRVQNSIDLCLLGFICLIISQMLLPLIAFSNLDRLKRELFNVIVLSIQHLNFTHILFNFMGIANMTRKSQNHGYETRTGPYGPTGKTSNRSFLRFF